MKRQLKLMIVLILVIITNLGISYAADSYIFNINGKAVAFTVAPKVVDGVLMVPTKQALTAYGATVTWDAPLKAVVIKFEDQTLVLPTTKGYALLKDIAFNLQYKTVNGVSYIETDVFKYLGASVTVNSKVYTITRLKTPIKEVPADERIWLSINDYTADLATLKTELDSFRTKLKNLPPAPYSETTYMISGDVIYDDENSTIVYGIAYGFGSGMHEGYIQVLKPHNGTATSGKFFGFNAYVGKAFSINYGEVKTYRKAKETATDPNAKVRAELNEKIFNLQKQYDYLSTVDWTDNIVKEISSIKNRVYNEKASFTVDYYTSKYPRVDAYETYDDSGYSSLYFKDIYNNIVYEIQCENSPWDEIEEDDNYKRIIDLDELESAEDGIVDAYVMCYYDSFRYDFAIILEAKDGKRIQLYLSTDELNWDDTSLFEFTNAPPTDEEIELFTELEYYKDAIELLNGINMYYVMG